MPYPNKLQQYKLASPRALPLSNEDLNQLILTRRGLPWPPFPQLSFSRCWRLLKKADFQMLPVTSWASPETNKIWEAMRDVGCCFAGSSPHERGRSIYFSVWDGHLCYFSVKSLLDCKDCALDTSHWKALETLAQEIAEHKARCSAEHIAIADPQKEIDEPDTEQWVEVFGKLFYRHRP